MPDNSTDLTRAIDAVLLVGHGQLVWLDRRPHPPLNTSFADAAAHYGGPGPLFSLWAMCRAVEMLRDAVKAEEAAADIAMRAERDRREVEFRGEVAVG